MPKMQQPVALEDIIIQLYKTINQIGLKRFLGELRRLNLPEFDEIEKELQNFIIETTAKHYSVSVSQMKGTYVQGEALIARKMCFVLMHKNLDCSMRNIGQLFDRPNHSLVSNAVKEWSLMTEKHPDDSRFIENYKTINELVMLKKDALFAPKKTVVVSESV